MSPRTLFTFPMPLPPPRLVTDRLILRTARGKDVPSILRFVAEERGAMGRFFPRRPPAQFTAAHWRRNVKAMEEERRAGRSVVFYLFHRRRPGTVIGRVALSAIVRGAMHGCFLGYALASRHQGKGLMTEALRGILPYAFGPLGLHRVGANYIPSNARSARVLRRLGFHREGLAPEYLLIDGKWRDHVLTALVNPEWKAPAL